MRNLKYELLGYTEENYPKNCRQLKPEAIPSLHLPKSKDVNDADIARQQRALKRDRSKVVGNILQSYVNCDDDMKILEIEASETVISNSTKSIGVNTENDTTQTEIIAQLKARIASLENNKEALQSIFTVNQIKKLQEPNRRPQWSIEDIANAIVIYSAGPRAYRLLLKKGYPFPAVSTLRSWCKKIKIAPGILKQVFSVIKKPEMTEMNKVCVLSFDEMKIRQAYLYDKVNDQTLKPYSYVQVVMLRGLFGNWKQPIFFDYDCKLTKDKLFDIITFVEKAGFPVVAIVSDMGGGNRSLHKELDVCHSKTWFLNPANNNKIYVFADVPHLIKLIRNHFVDCGFILNEKEINTSVIKTLLEVTSSSDLNIAHKISRENLTVQGAQRQKVKLATKLFSHTVSRAITRCGTLGYFEDENWFECAEFFKLVNDWFDCLNVRVPVPDSRERVKAFGLSLDVQIGILDKMTNTMTNLRVKGKSLLMPFQKGIIMTNNSLKLLYNDLRKRFDIKYLLTYRLNQDVLENFFGVIRSKGGLHDCPDALEFRYRLRAYILGRNQGSLSIAGNVEEDPTPDLLNTEIQETTLSVQCFSKLATENTEEDQDLLNTELQSLAYDGLENLAGFICHKIKETSGVPTTSSNLSQYTWVDHLSEGGLAKPSEVLMADMEQLEKIFNSVNSETLLICQNYLQNLMNLATSITCDDKIKSLFFRSRMYFRIKYLNKSLQDRTRSRKRKILKTVR